MFPLVQIVIGRATAEQHGWVRRHVPCWPRVRSGARLRMTEQHGCLFLLGRGYPTVYARLTHILMDTLEV